MHCTDSVSFEQQRLEASLRRAVRSGLYSADDPSFSQFGWRHGRQLIRKDTAQSASRSVQTFT